jgi:hypothetical protein
MNLQHLQNECSQQLVCLLPKGGINLFITRLRNTPLHRTPLCAVFLFLGKRSPHTFCSIVTRIIAVPSYGIVEAGIFLNGCTNHTEVF